MIDKKQLIVNGINTQIKMVEDNMKQSKEDLKKRIDEYIDPRFGIAKYAEQLTSYQAQLEAYYHVLQIINFVFEQK